MKNVEVSHVRVIGAERYDMFPNFPSSIKELDHIIS